ncbi:alpha-amylase family glycosyl hydrolase [Mucilaginibacter sp.]|uniref:alpha-amylase family glycosyl hydrolase n=1 Tax=Mucilaginibacter sp. TaxID=1882438 RepID=UPI002ED5A670
MKPNKLFILACLSFGLICSGVNAQPGAPPNNEIIYHIFQRSFYDSNGDYHGDLNGIRQKLDYLQELGVTSILLTPLYESAFYHNYFAIDFEKIDPKYGTLADYLKLIKELHRRGMKFYMDMETQYVTEDSRWWKEAFGNPKSLYSDYILWDDKDNKKPSTIVYNLTGLKGYDSVTRKITTANLNSEASKAYNLKLFSYWVDPNGDGKFDDGVDGFRLDHMMDDLDNKGRLPHLFDTFWNPLLTKLRAINPKINIVAEQANWFSLGTEYLEHGGVDRVFGLRLCFAIRSFDKKLLLANADSTLAMLPPGKQQVVFIENHDVPRFGSAVKGDLAKLKVGCAFNLLMGGIPSIYYGQELGMTGTSANFGATDANEIPNREAFEWYKSDTGKGMALWYKQTGPWKDQFNNDKPNDGISLEEEKQDPNSLWHYYKQMIAIRKANPAFVDGSYKTISNDNDHIFTFLRRDAGQTILVAINLSDKETGANIEADGNPVNIIGDAKPVIKGEKLAVNLPAFGVGAWELK